MFNHRVKNFFLILLLFIPLTFSQKVSAEETLPVNFKNLNGTWSLFYGNNYGYNFRFYKNYRAIVILYLNNASIVFKGIYNVESADTLTINVSEMKREEKITDINVKSGFTKAKSSYFIFTTRILHGSDRKKYLELRPVKIFIDGTESEGFFEPYIKLDYSGR
jgi:hypothetical protein